MNGKNLEIVVHRDLKWKHLVDLPYVYGEKDCFQIVRAFYKDNFGITMRDYAYPEAWWTDAPHLDLFRNNFQAEGFWPVVVERKAELLPGDLVLMDPGFGVICHAGVYLGNGWLLHHPEGQDSRVEPYSEGRRAMTMVIARHPEAKLSDHELQVELIDYLPAAKKLRYQELLQRMVEDRGGR